MLNRMRPQLGVTNMHAPPRSFNATQASAARSGESPISRARYSSVPSDVVTALTCSNAPPSPGIERAAS